MSAVLCASLAASEPTQDDWSSRQWDAIVVGAGTAGIIVADKLSEAGLSTLLLEMGGASFGITGGTEKPNWLDGTELSRVDVPGLCKTPFPILYRRRKPADQAIDKSIFAGNTSLVCPPEHVLAFQGCTIGGNSAINAGLFFQPPSSDWDDYYPEGWHSTDVQDATQRLLDRQSPGERHSPDEGYYLQSGYDAAYEWLVGSAGFSNISISEEPNNKEKVFGRPVNNYIRGQRGGPVRTYLQTALSRDNFHLQSGARVEYIVQEGGRASGVVATVSGTSLTIKLSPSGRVVVSAGALVSPQILMYSGIGPRDILSDLSDASRTPYDASSWVINPAVGEGLVDNPNTFIELSSPSIESYVYQYEDPVPVDRDEYLESRNGPYAFAAQTSVFWDYIMHDDGTRTGVQGTIDSAGYQDFTDNDTITLNVYGTSGILSSGRVILSGDNFTAGPSKDVYYSHPRDAKSVASFIHSIFQALPPSTPQEPATNGLTPLNIPQNSSVEEIRKYITTPSAYAVGQVNHWTSSCRIGSCIDINTKVIGTENIHVIDASVLAPPTANPQFPVMVAAEKGAENILAQLELESQTAPTPLLKLSVDTTLST